MGKPKKPKDEIVMRRRLAEKKRQECIKNDPVLYEQQKAKNRNRYLRRKQEKKILPISEMTAKDRKKAQKRNRDNFRAYYRRKKEQLLDPIDEEVSVDAGKPDDSDKDPLNIAPFKNAPNLLCLKDTEESVLPEECPVQPIIMPDLIENASNQSLKSETNLTNKTSNSSDCLAPISLSVSCTPSVSCDRNVNPEESTCLDTEDTFNNDTESNFSPCSIPIPYASISSRKKIKRRVNSSSLVFKRYKLKVNKEMAIMRKKIEDLKREKEKFRKQALRSKRLIYMIKKEINHHFSFENL